MMRKILVSVILLMSFYAQGQYSPTATKTKFVNGIALGTKDTNTLKNAADTINLTVSPDSTLRFRYKGYYRSLLFANDISGTSNRVAKFTGTNTLGNGIMTDNGSVVTVAGAMDVTGAFTVNASTVSLGSGSTLSVSGTITNAGLAAGSAGNFVVNGGSGLLVTRTAAQVLSDIGAAPSSGSGSYVPYTGATTAVNLGSQTLSSGAIAGTINSASVAVSGTNNGSGVGVNGNSVNGIGVYANSAAAANPAFGAIHTGGYRIAEFSNGGVVSHIANNGSFNGSVVGGTIDGTTGTFSGNVVLSTSDRGLMSNTSDGSDNKFTFIQGGGARSDTRGAGINLFGNESAGTGRMDILAGDVTGGVINLVTQGLNRVVVGRDGIVTVNAALNTPTGTSTSRAGNSTLVAGTVTVSNTTVTASTIVIITRKTSGGTIGDITYTLSAGTSFTITSASGTDTSTVSWFLLN